jgi:hypothetical protein
MEIVVTVAGSSRTVLWSIAVRSTSLIARHILNDSALLSSIHVH